MKYILTVLLLIGFTLPSAEAEAAAKKKAAAKVEAPSTEVEAAAKTLTPTQKTKLMEILNKGDDAALQSLPGIGETRAKAVVKGRPFAEPLDLLKVEGIGDATFARIVSHAKADFPEKAKKKASPKAEGEDSKKKAPTAEKKTAKE
ncbi:DNA uptake protein ComE [Prosthecobacter debontii]|uniref:DNA uptake protein ComE n=1 Tax=Prosthecobacter debontii TaxID=48467 RepID=A0A1T4Y5W6_9BACT|nr:helix-hairpin-helix domain-containing protein [Prosthecobacter debontii]SKA97110.1 DNA uptake protein ComE [Prosthecobacter debontii]